MNDLHILDRILEIPYRLRPMHHAEGDKWKLAQSDLSRVIVQWPIKYQWSGAGFILETLKDAFRRLGVLRMEEIDQKFEGVVYIIFVIDAEKFRISLDYSDYHEFVNEGARAVSDLYFKLMYRVGGYNDDKILPGGYTVTRRHYYKYYTALRTAGSAKPSIDVIARFGYRFQGDFRKRAVSMLDELGGVRVVGNTGKVRYSRFLKEVSQSRLALHMPGNGPFTHRVVEFLGLGTCMVSIPFETVLHVPLIPGIHYVEIAPDLSDLPEKVRYYLKNEDERQRIATAGADLFDSCCHSEHLVNYYLALVLAMQQRVDQSCALLDTR